MAYITITGTPIVDKTTLVTLITDALIAMGWALYDDQSASSYKVYKSNGEINTRPSVFLKVNYSTATVNLEHTVGWNNTTHTSVVAPSVSSTITPTATHLLWLFGNKDFIFVATENAGTIQTAKTFCSYVLNSPSGAVKTTTTEAITAGTSVSIPVASIMGFVVGAKYQVFDSVTGYRQTFTCTAVGTSTITADSIATVGYTAGSFIGTHTLDFLLNSSGGYDFAYNLNHHKATYNSAIHTPGNAYAKSQAVEALYLSLSQPYLGKTTKRVMFPPVCYEVATSPNSYRYLGDMEDANGYFYIVPHLSTANAADSVTGVNLDAIYFGQIDAGMTTGSNTVLLVNDTTKTWTTDIHAGKVIVCLSGPEVGQIRKIISNSATQLTVDTAFTTIPVSGNYAIVDRAYRYFFEFATAYLFREGA